MKPIHLFAALSLGLAGITNAGACTDFEPLLRQMNLSQDKSQALKAVLDKYKQMISAQRQSLDKSREAERAAADALFERQRKEVAALLTAEQLKQFDQFMHEHRPPPPPPPRPGEAGRQEQRS